MYRFTKTMLEEDREFHDANITIDIMDKYKNILLDDCSKANTDKLINDRFTEVDMLENDATVVVGVYDYIFKDTVIDTEDNKRLLLNSFYRKTKCIKTKI